MTDNDFFELANRVIDGMETDQEREALNSVIGQSMSRRLEFQQLSTVASILDAVRPVEPPEGLRNRILAAIPRETRATSTAPRVSIWQQVREFTAGRPGYALAYAVAMGLFFGLLGLAVLAEGPNFGSENPTYGTIGGVGGAFSVADRSELHLDGIQANASLLIREAEFVVEVDVESEEALEVVVSPVSEVTTWYGVELGGGARLTGARLDPDELRFPVEGWSAVRVSGLRADLGEVQCVVSISSRGRVVGEMILSESISSAE